jgi:L-malate glycosyltransferase
MKLCVAAPIATAEVAALLHEAPPAHALAGYLGAPLTAVLIGEFLRLGHTVSAVTLDYAAPLGSPPCILNGPGFDFTVLPGRPRAWNFNGKQLGRALDLFKHERAAVARAVASSGADLVHAHWTYEFALGALDSGLPHVVTAHDSPRQVLRYTRSPYRALRSLMAREVFAKAQCLTTVSPYMAQQLDGLSSEPITVIPNPLAAYVLGQGRSRSRPSALALGMVCNGWGRLKNAEVALTAFAQFRARHPLASLHLFGQDFGPGQTGQRWAQQAGVQDGLHFVGAVSHVELISRLAELDAVVHPSLEESFGVVLAEALALGLPTLAGHRSGAAPWVLGLAPDAAERGVDWPQGGGLVVDVQSVPAVLDGLHQLAGPQYENWSAAGRAMAAARFAPNAVAARYLAVFDHVLRQPVVSNHGVPVAGVTR